MVPANQNIPATVKIGGTTRNIFVPCCSLRPHDLRRLHTLLATAAAEAAAHEIFARRTSQDMNEAQALEALNKFRDLFRPMIRVDTAGGDWTTTTDPDILSDESIPSAITRVEFSSSERFRSAVGQYPLHFVSVTLDFSRGPLLDLSNESGQGTPNESHGTVAGTNASWVRGVHDQILGFFIERATHRDWLHGAYTYDALLFLLGLPLSLLVIYRVSVLLKSSSIALPDPITTASYVYLVLLSLVLFRVCFSYLRWMYPRVEVPDSLPKWPLLHRAIVIAIVVGVAITLFTDLIKLLFIKIFQ